MKATCKVCTQDLTWGDGEWVAPHLCKDEQPHDPRLFPNDAAEAEFRLLAHKVAEINGLTFEEGYNLLAIKSLENLERINDALNS